MRYTIKICPILLLVTGISLPVGAAEWSAEPSIALRTGYNDNVRLIPEEHDTVLETTVTPEMKFGVATRKSALRGSASAAIRRYNGGSGPNRSSLLDREDYKLKGSASRQSERGIIRGLFDYTRDSTLDSELDETGAVIEQRATRTRVSLGPSWSHLLNQRTELSLNYNYTTVSYSDEIGVSDLIGYDYDVISATLTRQLTPKLQGSVTSSYSRYEPDTNYDSETASLQIGLARSFSETLSTSWLAGVRRTTSDIPVPTGFCIGADDPANFPACSPSPPGVAVQTGSTKGESDNNGSVYSANITKLLEKGRLAATLTRTTYPSGNGELLDTTRLILSGQHKFTELLTSNISFEYSNAETIVNASGRPEPKDQDLYRIRPKLFWQFRREWELSAEYEYLETERTRNNSATATRNAFYLTLRYKQPKISYSR